MRQTLGLAPVVLFVTSVVLAVVLWVTGGPTGGGREMRVWTFDGGAVYPVESSGVPVRTELAPLRLAMVRTGARAIGSKPGQGASDVIETEITSAGNFFRDESFFLPLDQYLSNSSLAGEFVQARVELWRSGGKQLFLPRDVHPVTLTYRVDLWREAGVDLETITTWEELIQAGRKLLEYHRETVAPFELPKGNAAVVLLILQQRGVDIVAENALLDPRVAETLDAYGRWVREVGNDTTRTLELTAGQIARRELASAWTPDWRAGQLKRVAPELAGKMRMMPLPIFASGDRRSASWGGTGVGIPRDAPDVEKSWRLIEQSFLDRELQVNRYVEAGILPPVRRFWGDERIVAADPYFGGQSVGLLQVKLAEECGGIRPSPILSLVQLELNQLVAKAVNEPSSLREAIQRATARIELRRKQQSEAR